MNAKKGNRLMKKKKAKVSRREALAALHKESAKNDDEQILARLQLPLAKRTNFLRVRFPNGGSSL
jgi:hypothetical protein